MFVKIHFLTILKKVDKMYELFDILSKNVKNEENNLSHIETHRP